MRGKNLNIFIRPSGYKKRFKEDPSLAPLCYCAVDRDLATEAATSRVLQISPNSFALVCHRTYYADGLQENVCGYYVILKYVEGQGVVSTTEMPANRYVRSNVSEARNHCRLSNHSQHPPQDKTSHVSHSMAQGASTRGLRTSPLLPYQAQKSLSSIGHAAPP